MPALLPERRRLLPQLLLKLQVLAQSERFIVAYGRRGGNADYPHLLHRLRSCFRQTAEALAPRGLALDHDVGAIEAALAAPHALSALQQAHRRYLLKLQAYLA